MEKYPGGRGNTRISIWTPELTEKAIQRWNDGQSSAKIAAELGLTRNQVIGKLYRCDLIGSTPSLKSRLDAVEAVFAEKWAETDLPHDRLYQPHSEFKL